MMSGRYFAITAVLRKDLGEAVASDTRRSRRAASVPLDLADEGARARFPRSPKICAGGPASTTRPSSMNSTRSAAARAKPISCDTTTIVMPLSRSARITASTLPTSSGSSALVGSSNSMTRGSSAMARAIATRCCWPPESWPG